MADKDKITLEALRPYFKNPKYTDEYQKLHYERTLPKHIEQPDQWVFSWNWSAALFPDLWMLYRKMYWQGLLVFFISYLSGHLISYLTGSDSFVTSLIPYFFTFFIVGAVWALLAIAVILELSIFGF